MRRRRVTLTPDGGASLFALLLVMAAIVLLSWLSEGGRL